MPSPRLTRPQQRHRGLGERLWGGFFTAFGGENLGPADQTPVNGAAVSPSWGLLLIGLFVGGLSCGVGGRF